MDMRAPLPQLGWAIAMLAAWGPAGCFMSHEAGARLEGEMAALRGQVASLSHDLEQQRARQSEEHQTDANKIAALTRSMSSSDQAVRTHDADLSQQLEQMMAEVQQLRGALEASEHRSEENQSTLQRDLEQRLAQLQAAAQAAEAKRAQQEAVARTAPRNRRSALEEGIELLKTPAGSEEGQRLLRELVRKYPREKGLADEALFALGAQQQAERKCEGALGDFIKVVDFKPASKRAAEAYLGIAQCSEQLGRLDDAKTFYAELTQHFAQSASGKVARQRLDALRKQQGAPAAPPVRARTKTSAPKTPMAPPQADTQSAPAAPPPAQAAPAKTP